MTRATGRSAGLIGALVLVLDGCVYVPKTVEMYDTTCKTVRKEMYLEPIQVASFEGCRNVECKAGLAMVGAITATSAVISGSIVVAGNVVYWLEKQGDCPSYKGLPRPEGWFSAWKAETVEGEFQVDMAAVRRKACLPAGAECSPKPSADPAPERAETTGSEPPVTP